MDSSMVDEEASKIQPKAPGKLQPLAKLGWQIRSTKYKPTPQEGEVLGRCFEDAKWYFMNAPLAAGALMWSSTGGTRLKAFPRILLTISAAVIGHDLGSRVSGHSCMKKILSLEDSPLRGELIAILREDFPNHSLLKTDLVKHQRRSRPLYVTDDDSQDSSLPAPSEDWATRIVDRLPGNFEPSSEEQETGLRSGEEPMRLPRLRKPEPEPEAAVTRNESGNAGLMADPFDLVMQSVLIDDSPDGAEDGAEGRTGKERRRSRMSAKERREYDKEQYERWQQGHQNV